MGPDWSDSKYFPVSNVLGGFVVEQYNFEVIGKKKPSLQMRILFQVLSYLLVGVFLYVTYLGFSLRQFPVPTKAPAPSVSEQPAPTKK